MKMKHLLITILCSSLTLGFSACSDNDDDNPPAPIEKTTSGIYVLNNGNMGSNNTNISFYDFETNKLTSKIFEKENGISLGDTGQDMLIYGSKMYIAVYNSAILYVTDRNGKILKKIESQKDGQDQKPRGLTTYKGKVYVTMYDGYLAKIDTTELKIEDQVKVGRNPEYVRVANEKLYVANSGGLDYNTPIGYDNSVSVVDVATFKEDKKIEVVINPDKMAVDSQGDIYVISNGNYNDIPNTLQRIDAKTGAVTQVGNATWMSMMDDKLYIIYSQYDENWQQTITYHVFDAKTEKMITDEFISDNTKIEKPNSILTDAANGYVYIGTSDYKTNSDMYIFTKEGKLVKKFDTEGISPIAVTYVKDTKSKE